MSLFDIDENWQDAASMTNPELELIATDYRRCVDCDTTWKGEPSCFMCGKEGKRHYAEVLPGSWVFKYKENTDV